MLNFLFIAIHFLGIMLTILCSIVHENSDNDMQMAPFYSWAAVTDPYFANVSVKWDYHPCFQIVLPMWYYYRTKSIKCVCGLFENTG